MSKDFNEFRKLFNDSELVKQITNEAISTNFTTHFSLTPDGMERYHKELVTAIVKDSMIATMALLQFYHQWLEETSKDV